MRKAYLNTYFHANELKKALESTRNDSDHFVGKSIKNLSEVDTSV